MNENMIMELFMYQVTLAIQRLKWKYPQVLIAGSATNGGGGGGDIFWTEVSNLQG